MEQNRDSSPFAPGPAAGHPKYGSPELGGPEPGGPKSDDSGKGRSSAQRRAPWAQLSLARAMLILTVASAAAAPLAYLVRAIRGSRPSHFAFVFLCVAVPSISLVLVSGLYFLINQYNRHGGGKR